MSKTYIPTTAEQGEYCLRCGVELIVNDNCFESTDGKVYCSSQCAARGGLVPLAGEIGKITPGEYGRESRDDICPACLGDKIEGASEPVFNGDGIIIAPFHCTKCSATWKTIYQMQEYYCLSTLPVSGG